MAHTIYHEEESENPIDELFANYDNQTTDLPHFIELMNTYVTQGIVDESDLQSWAASYNAEQGTDFNVYNPSEWSYESSSEEGSWDHENDSDYLGGYGDAPVVLYENSAAHDAIWAPDTSTWSNDELIQFNQMWDPDNENQAAEWMDSGISAQTYSEMEAYADYLTIAKYGIEEFEASQLEGYEGYLESYAGNEYLPPDVEMQSHEYHGASTMDQYYLEPWASPTGERMYLSNKQVWEIQQETFTINGQAYSGEALLNANHGPIGYTTHNEPSEQYMENIRKRWGGLSQSMIYSIFGDPQHRPDRHSGMYPGYNSNDPFAGLGIYGIGSVDQWMPMLHASGIADDDIFQQWWNNQILDSDDVIGYGTGGSSTFEEYIANILGDYYD